MYKIDNKSILQKKIHFFDKCDFLKLKIFLLTDNCHTLLQLENAYYKIIWQLRNYLVHNWQT